MPSAAGEMGLHAFDFKTHLARGACQDAGCGFGILGVEVGHLDLTTSINWALVILPTLVRFASLDPEARPAAFLRRLPAGGRLGDEAERLVFVNRDHTGRMSPD